MALLIEIVSYNNTSFCYAIKFISKRKVYLGACN